jgi:hypothetical protein
VQRWARSAALPVSIQSINQLEGMTAMWRTAFVGAIVVLMGIALVDLAAQEVPTTKPAPGGEPDFKGKVLYVSMKEPVPSTILEHVRVRNLGNRTFLVGTYARKSDDDPVVPGTYWFPVDHVLQITEYRNLAEARKAFADRKPEKK